MSKMIFANLPARGLKASTAFHQVLGGALNPQFSGEKSSCMALSDAIFVTLLTHEHDRRFTQRPIGDARRESQVLIALSAESRDAINATLEKTAAAGGRADPDPPQDHGLHVRPERDGDVWEIFWMEPAAAGQTA